MFGSKRKQSKADAVMSIMDQLIGVAASQWANFCSELPFKADVPLADRIAAFTVPFFAGARQNVRELKDAPDAVLLLIVAKGIERSGTHTRAQIEQALGTKLPD